jgi:hypothetical protein
VPLTDEDRKRAFRLLPESFLIVLSKYEQRIEGAVSERNDSFFTAFAEQPELARGPLHVIPV